MPHLYLDPDLSFEFCLAGLNCHERDYRLVWDLNLSLGWELVRQEDVLRGTGEETDAFACYSYHHEEEKIHIQLLSNKSTGGSLIPEMVHVDYLLKLEPGDEFPDLLLSGLRKVRMVSACYRIDLESLRSRHHLLQF